MVDNNDGNGHIHYIARLLEILQGQDDLTREQALIQAGQWIISYARTPDKFAVIKIGGESIHPEEGLAQDFAEAMGIMSRLDLFPPIVYGWGKELTGRLNKMGIESKFDPDTQDRITETEKEMSEVNRIAEEYGEALVSHLGELNIKAKYVAGVFQAEPIEFNGIGTNHYTGTVTGVDVRDVILSTTKGYIPVVSPVGTDSRGGSLNVNGDTAAGALAKELKPRKMIMLTETGCVYDTEGNRVPKIRRADLKRDFISAGTVSQGMAKKLACITDALNCIHDAGNHCTAQIASPSNLVRELFTDEGAGTYIY